ncbi:MAG: hypothetical protein Q7K16_02420 [Candidatus Azambacteria bacterium]|nr:hypothetical protein [Candidatus Azambacteria bacterium]
MSKGERLGEKRIYPILPILLISSLSILLTGCAQNKLQDIEVNQNIKEEPGLVFATQKTDDDKIIEVVGGYSYYLKADNSFAPYKVTALHKTCFEPAQMETVNNGQMFCFKNTQRVLSILKIHKVDSDCKLYWGTAKIRIKNLTTKKISTSKSDPCVEVGNCEFNEADFIEVVETYGKVEPQCKK